MLEIAKRILGNHRRIGNDKRGEALGNRIVGNTDRHAEERFHRRFLSRSHTAEGERQALKRSAFLKSTASDRLHALWQSDLGQRRTAHKGLLTKRQES